MDPDAALSSIRKIVARALGGIDPWDDPNELLYDLAEELDNLDAWLEKGGLLPSSWQRRA